MFKYTIDTDRWSTVVEMEYSNQDGKTTGRRDVFLNPVEADRFVMAQLLAYLQRRLRNYIGHSRHIHQASKYPYYHTPLFRKSLRICQHLIADINNHNLFSLAHLIRSSADSLTRIVPLESNPSYYSSSETLKELLYLARFMQRQTQRTF